MPQSAAAHPVAGAGDAPKVIPLKRFTAGARQAGRGASAAPKPLAYRVAKRAFDVALSAAVVAIGAMPGALLAAAIAADTKGSPIYTQERVGLHGRTFRIHKFRTMVADSDDVEKYLDEEQLEQWRRERKVEDDPRITPLGRFLRETSIDEVPQFIDVLRGKMSVVGPRAMVADELEHFSPEERALLLSVPCGITGLWQTGPRNIATFESGLRQRLELMYASNASLALDAKIVGRTFGAVLGRTGR